MTSYTVGQYCRFVRERHDFKIHAFCLYLNVSTQALSDVSEVEYTLDPSFPDPVRVSSDRDHAFPMQSEAWGGFTTYVRIFTKSGKIERLQHRLVLEKNGWPMGKELSDFSSETERLIYNAMSDPKWEWRKLSTLARRAGVSVETASTVLASLESRQAVRKASHVHFIEKEELWGATSVVGLLPSPE